MATETKLKIRGKRTVALYCDDGLLGLIGKEAADTFDDATACNGCIALGERTVELDSLRAYLRGEIRPEDKDRPGKLRDLTPEETAVIAKVIAIMEEHGITEVE